MNQLKVNKEQFTDFLVVKPLNMTPMEAQWPQITFLLSLTRYACSLLFHKLESNSATLCQEFLTEPQQKPSTLIPDDSMFKKQNGLSYVVGQASLRGQKK